MSSMQQEIQEMRERLQELAQTAVEIKAVGRYPVKRRTRVADVAVYQNDGTEKISPARFVERAEALADGWKDEIEDGIDGYIEGQPAALHIAGTQIAADITDMCDRIDTGRLKASFRTEVKRK